MNKKHPPILAIVLVVLLVLALAAGAYYWLPTLNKAGRYQPDRFGLDRNDDCERCAGDGRKGDRRGGG